MDKLETCRQTREIAAESFYIALNELLKNSKQISEIDLRDAWLLELRKHENIFPDGWYIPPPYGIAVLFGTDTEIERVNISSLRPQENWPRNDVFLDTTNGLMFIYASPVDKQTGIIGDFGLTLYLGNNQGLKKHLQTCFCINKQIFNYAKAGMHFSEITNFTLSVLEKNGLTNNIASPNDPTGTNVGHTIPVSYEDWNNNELKTLHDGSNNWESICSLISKKRRFVNAIESLKIHSGMAFTIEPRPQVANDTEIPQVYFHTIAMFKPDDSKELLTNFDEIFKLMGMDYLL